MTAQRKEKILVIDDDEDVLRFIERILKQCGFENCVITSNVKYAIEKIDNGQIAAILCDWHMPNMNGIDVLRAVREHDQSVPFVMVTSERDKSCVMEAVRAGVTDYLIKPVTKFELADKLEKLFPKT